VHHDFIASVIIPNYFVYSDNRRLHRHLSLFVALRTSTITTASYAGPSDIGTRFMMVSTLACLVLATPVHAFIPHAFSSLASSAQQLVFICFHNVFLQH
jgi:hypothetical protein